MLRAVADTNIYISAFNFGGAPDEVLTVARRGQMELFISAPILDEIARVLRRKFEWPPGRMRDAIAAVGAFARTVEPHERVTAVSRDEPDNRIIECALAAKASIIVTGDSHLLELRSFRRIKILGARALLDALGV